MRAGLMRDYVTIQRNTPTQGLAGEEIDNWATWANAWVYLRATDGDESIRSFKATMRYMDVVHTDRVVFGARIFDIVTVLDKSGMGREIQLELREDTSG